MAFVHRATIRFFQVDRAGILFFGRLFELCHEALEELLLAMGLTIDALIDEHGVGMPVVHSEADFERPMRLHERINISLSVERVGAGSMTLAFELVGEDGVRRARALVVHAFADLSTFKGTGPPDALLEGLRSRGLLPADSA